MEERGGNFSSTLIITVSSLRGRNLESEDRPSGVFSVAGQCFLPVSWVAPLGRVGLYSRGQSSEILPER